MPKKRKWIYGDIYEFQVFAQLAYFQYVKFVASLGEVVRVFTTLHDKRPENINDVLVGNSYRVFLPISAFLSKPVLAHFVGTCSPIDEDLKPLHLKVGNGIYKEEEQGALPPLVLPRAEAEKYKDFSKISHTNWALLLWTVLRKNGITADYQSLVPCPEDEPTAGHTQFYLYFPKKDLASSAKAALRSNAAFKRFKVKVEKQESPDETTWAFIASGQLIDSDDLEKFGALFSSLAVEYGGVYDGFETPIS